jgi:hypothetical protein
VLPLGNETAEHERGDIKCGNTTTNRKGKAAQSIIKGYQDETGLRAKFQAMKTYGRVDIKVHGFSTSTLDGSDW